MSRGEKVFGLLLLYVVVGAGIYRTFSRLSALEARLAAAEDRLSEMERQ